MSTCRLCFAFPRVQHEKQHPRRSRLLPIIMQVPNNNVVHGKPPGRGLVITGYYGLVCLRIQPENTDHYTAVCATHLFQRLVEPVRLGSSDGGCLPLLPQLLFKPIHVVAELNLLLSGPVIIIKVNSMPTPADLFSAQWRRACRILSVTATATLTRPANLTGAGF